MSPLARTLCASSVIPLAGMGDPSGLVCHLIPVDGLPTWHHCVTTRASHAALHLEEVPVFLMEARRTLHLSQQQLGDIMGLSKRTIIRMEQGRSTPLPSQYVMVARALCPVNQALAEHYAAAAGTTLVGAGSRGTSARAHPAFASPFPAVRRPGHVQSLADSVVCVAAEAMDASPRAVRPALLAAFERMKALGMGVRDGAAGARSRQPRGAEERQEERLGQLGGRVRARSVERRALLGAELLHGRLVPLSLGVVAKARRVRSRRT